jgi:hypothetical protein
MDILVRDPLTGMEGYLGKDIDADQSLAFHALADKLGVYKPDEWAQEKRARAPIQKRFDGGMTSSAVRDADRHPVAVACRERGYI